MKYIIKEHHFKIPDKALLNDLRETAKILGKQSLKCYEYRVAGNFGTNTIQSRFGSWNNALEKAGLKIFFQRKYTEDDLLKNLKNVWDSLGRQPCCKEVIKPLSKYNYKVYNRMFGNWNNTLKEFVKFAGKKGGIKIRKPNMRLLKKKMRKDLYKPISGSMRFEIFKRDKYKCKICGMSPALNPKIILHVDHIIPVIKGGKTEPGNLQTLCNECNLGKSDKSV